MRSLATQLLRRPLVGSHSSSWRANSSSSSSLLSNNYTGMAAVLLATAVVVHHHNEATTATEAPLASLYLEDHGGGTMRQQQQHVPAAPTTTSAASEPKAYPISIRAVKGYRVTMEDEYCIADANRFAAIFDGHGGGRVSRLLRHSLWPTVVAELEALTDKSSRTYATALRRAFATLDQRILEDRSLRYQGSTAVAVWVHTAAAAADEEHAPPYRTLLAANIGDSRAVLSRNGTAVALTRDHKPNDAIERARLQAMGETIEWDRFAKVHRVRNLSLSRALGDVYARPAVSGDVEIQHVPIQEGQDEFVVLASDGLWDTMSSQEAVSFVHETLQQAEAAPSDRGNYRTVVRRHMSKYLTREALNRGSGDNICVVVIWLQE